MVTTPWGKEVEIGESKFRINVSLGAKLAFLKCVDPKSDDLSIEIDKLVEAVLKYGCISNWENVSRINEHGDAVQIPFTKDNIGLLTLSTLTELAIRCFDMAYGDDEEKKGAV